MMFKKSLCNILLIYEKTLRKSIICMEDEEKHSIINKYHIEVLKDKSIKTYFLKKTTLENSSIELIKKSINEKDISYKEYSTEISNAKILEDILNSEVNKQIDSDYYLTSSGMIGEIRELDWAERCLGEIGISIKKEDFEWIKTRCLIL